MLMDVQSNVLWAVMWAFFVVDTISVFVDCMFRFVVIRKDAKLAYRYGRAVGPAIWNTVFLVWAFNVFCDYVAYPGSRTHLASAVAVLLPRQHSWSERTESGRGQQFLYAEFKVNLMYLTSGRPVLWHVSHRCFLSVVRFVYYSSILCVVRGWSNSSAAMACQNVSWNMLQHERLRTFQSQHCSCYPQSFARTKASVPFYYRWGYTDTKEPERVSGARRCSLYESSRIQLSVWGPIEGIDCRLQTVDCCFHDCRITVKYYWKGRRLRFCFVFCKYILLKALLGCLKWDHDGRKSRHVVQQTKLHQEEATNVK